MNLFEDIGRNNYKKKIRCQSCRKKIEVKYIGRELCEKCGYDGVEIIKKYKAFFVTILIGLTLGLIISGSYLYGLDIGNLQGRYNMVGTEGLCNVVGNNMYNDRCVILNNTKIGEEIFIYDIDCVWGEYISIGSEKLNLVDKLILVYLQCEVTK